MSGTHRQSAITGTPGQRSGIRVWPGAEAFTLSRRAGEPRVVHAAYLVWLTALAAGLVEAVYGAGDALLTGPAGSTPGIVVGVAVRLAIYGALAVVMAWMRTGHNGARITLTVLLGLFGTLSLIMEPISILIETHSLAGVVNGTGFVFAALLLIRIIHLAAVFVGITLMFHPSARPYFRRQS